MGSHFKAMTPERNVKSVAAAKASASINLHDDDGMADTDEEELGMGGGLLNHVGVPTPCPALSACSVTLTCVCHPTHCSMYGSQLGETAAEVRERQQFEATEAVRDELELKSIMQW